MPATRDGKTWRSQFYYEDWQGVRHKKNKRGFKTKAEAEEWERNFRQQQRKDLDINFENFVEIYFSDVENRLRESTIKNKRYVFDLKVTPYFKKKKMCEIKTSDIRAWQNELIKQGYAPTYLKSINNQLAALFNYAVRYYDLNDNPCRKAGSIGKSKADDMEFWTKQEFKQFIPSMDKKPEARMAFMLLYWTGMRIGELLALTYEDIDLEKRIISISKSYQRLDGKDVITPPKTPKSNRKITIPPFLAEELKEYCSHLYGIMPNERMFRFTKSYMEHEIVRGIKETGVKRIRIHDLRHSHASLLVELLIIMLFMYMMNIVGITEETNFAFTLAALILSVSMAVDTFAKQNRIAQVITFIMEVCTLLVIVLFPNLKDFMFLKKLMSILDTNVLLLLALFFTFAGQWATEIKIKDIENRKGK